MVLGATDTQLFILQLDKEDLKENGKDSKKEVNAKDRTKG